MTFFSLLSEVLLNCSKMRTEEGLFFSIKPVGVWWGLFYLRINASLEKKTTKSLPPVLY